jgi:hypothetical protein
MINEREDALRPRLETKTPDDSFEGEVEMSQIKKKECSRQRVPCK